MRLIDADYVKRGNPWKDDVLRAVREAPTIDAVQVIRCKDCKFYLEDGVVVGCPMMVRTDKDDYCSFAERKEE